MGHQANKMDLLSSMIMMVLLAVISGGYTTQAKLNPVLDINETFPYLIDRATGQVIQPRDYMDFENIYSPNNTYKQQQTVQGRNYYMLKAFDFANYYQADYWHYSNEDDLRQSALPVANELKCAQQLDWLQLKLQPNSSVGAAAALFKPGEQHIQLASLMDSFGRPEASTYMGHGYWLGSHYECSKVIIDMDKYDAEECAADGKKNCKSSSSSSSNSTTAASSSSASVSQAGSFRTRYCIGKAREIDWPEDNYVPRISYKVGLCLPESCQTLSIAKHKHQLEQLMRLNMPEYLRSRIVLDDMYCLPDKRSPIRAISLSGRVYLALLAAWLVALLVATALYSCLRRHQKDLRRLAHQMRAVDLTATTMTTATGLINTTTTNSASLNQQQQLSIDVKGADDSPSTPQGKQESLPAVVAEQQKNYLVNYIIPQVPDGSSHPLKSGPASPALLIIRRSKHDEFIASNDEENLSRKIRERNDRTNNNNQNHNHNHNNTSDSQSESSYSSSSSSLSAWLKDSPLIVRGLQALSITENMREFAESPKMLQDPEARLKLRINLNALDAIKCLCCVLVIFGHVVFIHMQHMTNIMHTIELSNDVAPRFLMAFFNFVDTFFIISGMLTAYFIFKRFNKRSFANPIIWIYISALRLVRLTPVYVLVFWFTKTITVHLSDGPVWDYGTDKNSIRGLCQNDHWWKSILYLGNVGTMQPLCILPAWSIILDAQYSLFVPPLLFLIFRHKRLGYLGLLVAVIISTANMSYQLATQTAVKTSDMAKVRLHVYPLISRFAAEFYNTAWNRLGPIAVGILGGHMLYMYDIQHIRRWPYFMRGAYFKFILILHMLIFLLPTIGRLTDDPMAPTASSSSSKTHHSGNGSNPTEPDSMVLFVLSNATVKPIWSIINTIFLLRLITDLRLQSVVARVMSHNIWHCLGKLCFASYLVHYEIILVLLKSRQDDLMDPNWWNVTREFSAAFLISTLVAYLIYVLYEAPINKLIMLKVDKSNLVKDQKLTNFSNHHHHHHHHHQGETGIEVDADADDDDDDDEATAQISDTLTKSQSSASNNSINNYRYDCVNNQKQTKSDTNELANMA